MFFPAAQDAKEKFRRCLADFLGCDITQLSLFFKGRVALYAILKALGLGPADEVILPAFTCVGAINPIIYCGAKPVYVDIDPRTYTLDVAKLEKAISCRTKVILAQNTFGLSADLDSIISIAQRHRLWVVEDCAQGFGGTYKGKPNGTTVDASFFSTQWNKSFSTGLGGIALAKDSRLAQELTRFENMYRKPSLLDRFMLGFLMFVRDKLVTTENYWKAQKVYRWLSYHNFVLGSSQRQECLSPQKPPAFEKGFSQLQAKKGCTELNNITELLAHRKYVAGVYEGILKDLDKEPAYQPSYAQHAFLRYPLLVKDRGSFFAKAEKEAIEIGDWFISPIHFTLKEASRWYYKMGKNPVAEKISQHIVNLPTYKGIYQEHLKRIEGFLRKNKDDILVSYKVLT